MENVFKYLDEKSLLNDSRYPKYSTLNFDKAIAYKNNGWNLVNNSSFTEFPSVTASVTYVNSSSFSVAYVSQLTSSNYAEYLPFQMLCGQLGVPYNIFTNKYDFYINNEQINEAIIIAFDVDRFKNQIDPKNFFIALSGSTGTSSTPVSASGYFSSAFLTLAPYYIKESYETGSMVMGVTEHISSTPIYELRTSNDVTYLKYDSGTDSVKVDWSKGTISEPLGYLLPEQGLILILPSKLTSYTQLLNAINDTGAQRSKNVANSIMYIGGYGLEYVEKKVIFIRLENDEFNYTNNPTAFEAKNSQINYKDELLNEPKTYISNIGIYNDQNELLIIASLSEPDKKTELDFITYKIVVEI